MQLAGNEGSPLLNRGVNSSEVDLSGERCVQFLFDFSVEEVNQYNHERSCKHPGPKNVPFSLQLSVILGGHRSNQAANTL